MKPQQMVLGPQSCCPPIEKQGIGGLGTLGGPFGAWIGPSEVWRATWGSSHPLMALRHTSNGLSHAFRGPLLEFLPLIESSWQVI